MCHSYARLSTGAVVFIGFMNLLAVSARAQATFPGAAPVSAGNVTIQIKPELFDRTLGTRSVIDRNVVSYGASPNLAIIMQNNSFVANSVILPDRNGTRQVTASGFGDTTLAARYTVVQVDGPGSTLRIAPYVGAVIPTGMDNTNSFIPRAGQPGTGAWASRDAVTMSYQTLDWNAAAEVGYQANSSAGNYRFGNATFADLAYRYRIWPIKLEKEVSGEIYGVLEANYTSIAANRTSDGNVSGAGGKLLLVDPGVIYTTKSYSFTLLGQLPAYEHLRGSQSHFNYGLIGGFRYSLFTPFHW